MVKVVIKRRVKRTKPIRIHSNKEFILKTKPIVINYIPRKGPEFLTLNQLFKKIGLIPTEEQEMIFARMNDSQKKKLLDMLISLEERNLKVSNSDLSNLINEILIAGNGQGGLTILGSNASGPRRGSISSHTLEHNACRKRIQKGKASGN